jgi:hypothetical protein
LPPRPATPCWSDRAGFLFGHALRCGIAESRVDRSAALMGRVISAYAADSEDLAAARTQFTERALASLVGNALGDPVPSCAAIRANLALLEQHRPPVAAATATTPPREELTAERRAALASRRAARPPLRGGPPAI